MESLTRLTGGASATNASSAFSNEKTRSGGQSARGVEGAIPNTRDWTWKIEYLYIDFGHIGASGTDTILDTYS